MNFFKRINLLLIMLIIPVISQAADYKEGVDYSVLAKPIATQTGDKVEVLEFFWYGCPHCYTFEPALKKWKKNFPANAQFIRMPSPLNPRWMVHTKAYYTLMTIGEGDKHHESIFKAMHIEKKKLFSKDSIADFLVTQGVNKETFLANFDSFAVEMRARQALQLGTDYKVNGVPMLTVNGKYTISSTQAGGYEGMVKIASYLIKKESK